MSKKFSPTVEDAACFGSGPHRHKGERKTDKPKIGVKLRELPTYELHAVIEVLKAGIVYDRLLDGFESAFVNEIAPRYAKYGFDMVVVGEQMTQFKKLAVKLNININTTAL
jgi:hypothetical protein